MVDRTSRPVVATEHSDEREHRRQLAMRASASLPKDGTERMAAPLPLMTYTMATLPDPSLWAGGALYVSDGATGAKFLASDGTSWLPLDVGAYIPPGGSVVEMLTANRDYYVRTDGSDSNDGLANTSGGAFLTIQHAVDVVTALHFNNKAVTIYIADGTYNEPEGVAIGPLAGVGPYGGLYLYGNTANPENVEIVPVDGSNCIHVYGAYVRVTGVSVGSSVRDGLVVDVGGWLAFDFIYFRNARYHIRSSRGAFAQMYDDFYVFGNATGSVFGAEWNGHIELQAGNVFFNPGVTFVYCAQAKACGTIAAETGFSRSGGGTGQRYIAYGNGAILTNGGGPNVFAGTIAGTVGSGADWGVYT